MVGISPTLFDKAVEAGTMPQPRTIATRNIWDADELVASFKAIPHKNQSRILTSVGLTGTHGTMPRKYNNLPKGVSVDRGFRKKQPRYYFRALGKPKVRLREIPGTADFEQEVACARLGIPYIPANEVEEPPVLVRAA